MAAKYLGAVDDGRRSGCYCAGSRLMATAAG